MIKLNRKVEYCFIALKHMSSKKPGQLTSAKEIADEYNCPFDATARVLQVLAQNGVLRSEQGINGGYQIIRDLKKVNLLDLVEMIEGPVGIVKCLHEADSAGPGCEMVSSCNITAPAQFLNQRLLGFYKGISVMEVVEAKNV